ncbi:hypothetical protein G6F56_002013 [Rhizopus delemar]|nr:hypothetical protein G6F56_002013 [Rhizopus delemar]
MSTTYAFRHLPFTNGIKTSSDQDEEASSILVALANQHDRHSKMCSTKKSMSIHNLLDANEKSAENKQKVNNPNLEPLISSKSTEHLIGQHYNTETPSQISYNRRSSISESHSDRCSAPPTPPSYHPYLYKQKVKYPMLDGRLQTPAYFGYFPVNPSETKRSYRMHPSKIGKVRVMQREHPVHQDKIPYSLIKKPQEFANAQYLSMKQDPKFRRNALQAYISYMTYADMTRRKMQSTPLSVVGQPVPLVPEPIIEKPLTAFLRQSSTPLPRLRKHYY